MAVTHQYQVNVDWKSDRLGTLSSPDFEAVLDVVTPPQFPGGISNKWSPEHLLVAAVNSCLMTTFLAIAENSKLLYKSFQSNAYGKLELLDGKYMISEITLKPVLEIEDASLVERADRVLQKSEAACLISNSVKSKIIFEPQVRVVHK